MLALWTHAINFDIWHNGPWNPKSLSKASKLSLMSEFGTITRVIMVTALSTKLSVTFSLDEESLPAYLGRRSRGKTNQCHRHVFYYIT